MLKFHYVSARQQAARIFVFLVHFFKQFLQTLENALGVSLATINCLRHSWRRNRVESFYRWHFSVLFLMKMKIGFEKHFLMPPPTRAPLPPQSEHVFEEKLEKSFLVFILFLQRRIEREFQNRFFRAGCERRTCELLVLRIRFSF